MFKVGDEVEHVGGFTSEAQQKLYGCPAFIHATGDTGRVLSLTEYGGMQVSCRPLSPFGYDPQKWRKVERKTETLTRWLSQPVGDTDKLDKSKRKVSS